MKLKCKRCGYSWEYGGKLGFATCPNCLRKVEIKKKNGKEVKE